MQLPLFKPESDWSPPSLDELPSWEGARRVAIDVETCDPHLKTLGPSVRRGGFIAGISFAIEDGPGFYLPIRHQQGDNLPPSAVLSYLRDQAKTFRGDIAGANLSYDLDYLAQDGVEFTPRYFRDVQVADPLLWELHQSYSLDAIAQRYKIPGKDESMLVLAAKTYGVDPKGGLWRLPPEYVGAYAERDARLPLYILQRQERQIEDQGLWDIYNLESQVLPVLVKLRRRGVRIDEEKQEEIENWALDEEAKAFKTIRSTGHKVSVGDCWNANLMAPVLESIGMELEQTEKGQPSITADVLSNFEHPVAQAMLWARKVSKLRQFSESISKYIVNGRIHCTFNQMARESEKGGVVGARFGRMSAMDPNLQNQPARDTFSSWWREIYVPEEGALWGHNDYSQQEPRWTTHFANLLRLPGAAAAAQRYRDNPKMDNHKFMAEITGIDRDRAKPIFLGICYGEGGAKLCDTLGLGTRWALRVNREVRYFETEEEARRAGQGHANKFVWRAAGEEGQAILDKFDERAPFIRMLADAAQDKAKRLGIIRTVGGRAIHFPEDSNGNYEWTHKALNRLIQGSAGDQIKTAVVALDRELPEFYMQLLVHDEINGSIPDPEVGKKAAQVMEECIKITVPFVVKPVIAENWGKAK